MEWIDRLQGMFEEHVPEEWRNSPYFLPGTIAVAVGTPFIFSLLQWNSKRIQEGVCVSRSDGFPLNLTPNRTSLVLHEQGQNFH